MSDTISRQAAIDLLKQMRKDGDMVPWEGKNVFARIRELPTIQPEIVRCKDCKHFESEYGYCEYYQWNMTGGDFCSKAEKREVTE